MYGVGLRWWGEVSRLCVCAFGGFLPLILLVSTCPTIYLVPAFVCLRDYRDSL